MTCRMCGNKFLTDTNKRYCSDECKKKGHDIIHAEWLKKNQPATLPPTTKICKECGKEFIAKGSSVVTQLYCGVKCRKKAGYRAWLERETEWGRQTKKQNKKKPEVSLEEMNRRAKEAGLSYGQYMARELMKK